MMNTIKLEKILKKKKDKMPVLSEILNLTAQLCRIPNDIFFDNFDIALDKVDNLLFLQTQSKKSTGYILTDSDYKAVGIFQNHIKKNRLKSKKSIKADRLIKLMPKLYEIKRTRNLNFTQLKAYTEKKYKIKVSRTYLVKIFKKMNL